MVPQDHREPAPSLRSELTYAVLVHRRERVRCVLQPHLGDTTALERANNIVQALALGDAEPERVAFDMLRQLPDAQRADLADQVMRAWLDGVGRGRGTSEPVDVAGNGASSRGSDEM